MLDILLFLLGLKTWEVDFYPIKRYNIQKKPKNSLKNNKTVNTLNLIAEDTPSPKMDVYRIKRLKDIKLEDKIFYVWYSIYSFMIFLLLSVQPVYALYRFAYDVSDLKFLSSFLYSSNIPIIYSWEKMYFRCDHLEKELKCKKVTTGIISLCALFSIGINFLDIASFYNSYYWIDLFNNDIIFFSVIIIEWLYSRLIVFLYSLSFVFVMNSHVSDFRTFIEELKGDEWCIERESPLTTIISRVVIIRRQIETTISYYNNIISVTTILGGASLVIFIRDIVPRDTDAIEEIELEDHDRYLIHPSIVYISCQIALLMYMSKYAMHRNIVLKHVRSIDFINRFLSKIPDEKIHKKTNGKLDIVALNIVDSSSATLDWIILGNILSEQWLDFTICGISTSDGSLIKKSIAFGSAIVFVVSFLHINN